MGRAVELRESGDNDTLGLIGATASRRFVVYVANTSETIYDVLTVAIPPDTPHPDPRFRAALATDYIQVERIAPLTYLTEILYKTAEQRTQDGGFNGWTVRVRFETLTENVGRSLPQYDSRGRKLDDGILVGPHIYRPAVHPEIETHEAISPQTGERLPLVQLGSDNARPPIHVTPLPRMRSRMVLEFIKTAPRMSFATFSKLGDYRNYVNDKAWLGFQPATLMFTDCVITEETSLNQEGYTEFRYPITLQFTHEPQKWTPLELVEVYEDESFGGVASEVINLWAGTPAIEINEYPWYLGMNFDTLFSIAGTGVIGNSIQIQPTLKP